MNEYFKTDLGTLYCGDCFQVMKTLQEKSVDLVLTDPPYGMNFQSNHRKEKHEVIVNDSNLDWLEVFLKQLKLLAKNEFHSYLFCSWHNLDVFKQKIQEELTLKNMLIWEKNNTGMGGFA